MLLLGEGVENLMWDIVALSVGLAGLEWAGPLRFSSSSSSMASPPSPSCWFTSFSRSTTSSMDTGSWDTKSRQWLQSSRFDTWMWCYKKKETFNIKGNFWKFRKLGNYLFNVICICIVDLRQVDPEFSQESDAPVLGLLHPIAGLLWQALVNLPRRHSTSQKINKIHMSIVFYPKSVPII